MCVNCLIWKKCLGKLILPAPQISDKELEDIVKIGHATDAISQYADSAPTRFELFVSVLWSFSHLAKQTFC